MKLLWDSSENITLRVIRLHKMYPEALIDIKTGFPSYLLTATPTAYIGGYNFP